jgi:hypothetical protein
MHGASAQEQDWDKVVAAAKKEGTVSVYHAQLGAPHWKLVVQNFEKIYGIKVQEFDARGERVRRVDIDGSVTELIELEDLRKLWKSKGLPVD